MRKPCRCAQVVNSCILYCKSRKNSYQYCKSHMNLYQYCKSCMNLYQYCKSRMNLYQYCKSRMNLYQYCKSCTLTWNERLIELNHYHDSTRLYRKKISLVICSWHSYSCCALVTSTDGNKITILPSFVLWRYLYCIVSPCNHEVALM